MADREVAVVKDYWELMGEAEAKREDDGRLMSEELPDLLVNIADAHTTQTEYYVKWNPTLRVWENVPIK